MMMNGLLHVLLLVASATETLSFLPATTVVSIEATSSSLKTNGRLYATAKGDSVVSDNAVNEKEVLAKRPQAHYDSIICGGGPAGLLSAIMLSQKYGPSHRIAVCERRPTAPPSPADEEVWNDVARFYLLGIGHRGQRALTKFGIFDDFEKASVEVNGRRDWQPGMTKVEDGRITPAKKDVKSRILARDKLVGVLHHHLVENYIEKQNAQIDLLYGFEVEPISFGDDNDKNGDGLVQVRISRCEESSSSNKGQTYFTIQELDLLCEVDSFQEATTRLLIGSDGAARTVANAMEKSDAERRSKMNPLRRVLSKRPFKVTRFVDDNPRLFKSVPIRLPSDWPKDLNYSARSRESRITLEALPSDDKGTLCALLLLKPEDEFSQPNVDPAKLRSFFDEEFPQFGALIDDEEMARLAKKPASALPAFRYSGPRLHFGKRTLVLGDAAHTVKPYYGLGCNTALEDVEILSDVLDEVAENKNTQDEKEQGDVVAAAVPLFSKRRAGDARALVTISRNMDRSGKLFIVNFLLPLILDGIFHKLAPKIFGPNMFGMFQRKDLGFQQIQRKKRIDRTLQVSIIATILTGMGLSVKLAIMALSKALGKSPKVVTLGLAMIGATAAMIQKATAKQGDTSKA